MVSSVKANLCGCHCYFKFSLIDIPVCEEKASRQIRNDHRNSKSLRILVMRKICSLGVILVEKSAFNNCRVSAW